MYVCLRVCMYEWLHASIRMSMRTNASYWRMQNNCSSSDRFITVQCRIFALRVLCLLQAVTCNAEKQTVSNGRSLCNYFAYASKCIRRCWCVQMHHKYIHISIFRILYMCVCLCVYVHTLYFLHIQICLIDKRPANTTFIWYVYAQTYIYEYTHIIIIIIIMGICFKAPHIHR